MLRGGASRQCVPRQSLGTRRRPFMTTTTSTGGTRLSLLARARARETTAWSELVRLYAPLVAHWCRRCGLDSHDAADCMQEVFAAVASSLGTYKPRDANGSFRAWLWTITR